MRLADFRPLTRGLALLAGLTLSLAAQATLLSPVQVQLLAPGGIVSDATPLSLGQNADVLSAGQGGSGAISNMMLDDEFIKVVNNSIHVRLEAGSEDANGTTFTTGYLGDASGHARYLFGNLNITGYTIYGLAASAIDDFADAGTSGFAGPGNAQDHAHFIDAHTVSLDLDELLFAVNHRFNGGYRYMDIRIDLLARINDTQPPEPLPEPGSLALTLLGVALLWRRRAAQGKT